jgi:hypothetical protein
MIAIDPGTSGGLVFNAGLVEYDGKVHDVDNKIGSFAMPDNDAEIIELLRPHIQDDKEPVIPVVFPKVYVEALVYFSGKKLPGSSMMKYAGNQRFVIGVLKTFGYTVVEVHPKAWQKAVGLTKPKKTKQDVWKRMLRDKAQELFPGKHITLKTADAYLILYAALTGKV